MSGQGDPNRWRSIHQPPLGKTSAGEPWDRPLGTAVPEGVDPRELPGARAFDVYTVEPNDLHFTIYVNDVEHRRLFVAETPEAVYVVVVDQPQPQDDALEHVRISVGPYELHGMLAQPLAGRPIVDATRRGIARRLRKPPTLV